MTQYKILVVDDEENIRTLVQTMLKQEGRHVVLAARGKDAIAMFQKERPESDDSGYRHAGHRRDHRLEANPSHRPSGESHGLYRGDSPSVEREARALGVTDFLQKGLALPPLAELQSRGSQSAVLEVTPSTTSPVLPRKV